MEYCSLKRYDNPQICADLRGVKNPWTIGGKEYTRALCVIAKEWRIARIYISTWDARVHVGHLQEHLLRGRQFHDSALFGTSQPLLCAGMLLSHNIPPSGCQSIWTYNGVIKSYHSMVNPVYIHKIPGGSQVELVSPRTLDWISTIVKSIKCILCYKRIPQLKCSG